MKITKTNKARHPPAACKADPGDPIEPANAVVAWVARTIHGSSPRSAMTEIFVFLFFVLFVVQTRLAFRVPAV